MKNKDVITTLLKIEEFEKEILDNSLIKYYLETEDIILFNNLLDIIDKNDYIEIIEKYNFDMKKSIEQLSKFIIVLNNKLQNNKTIENDEFLKEIYNNNNKKIFPLQLGFLQLNFSKNNNLLEIFINNKNINLTTMIDIPSVQKILSSIYNLKYLNINKNSISTTPFSFIFGEQNQTANEYLLGLKKLPERIEIKEAFLNFAESINKSISKIENNSKINENLKRIFGKGRSTIKETLKDSLYISKYNNVLETINLEKETIKENENEISIKQKKLKNEKIDELKKIFLKNKNFNSIEIDKETSLIELIKLFEILNEQNIDFSKINKNIELKIRKLGNYNATGLVTENNDKIIAAIDPRTPFSLMHEIGHLIYDYIIKKDENLIENTNQLISYFKTQITNIPLNKTFYFYKKTEIFARLSEVAYMLNLMDYYSLVKHDPYNNKVKLFKEFGINQIKEGNYKSNGLISNLQSYFDEKNKGIYFNLENLTVAEFTSIYVTFQEFFKFDNKFETKDLNKNLIEIRKNKTPLNETLILLYKNKKNINIDKILYNDFEIFKENIRIFKNREEEENIKKTISNLKKSIIFNLINDDETYNEYTNKEELLFNIKNYYENIIKQKRKENLINSIKYYENYNTYQNENEKFLKLYTQENNDKLNKYIQLNEKIKNFNLKKEIYNYIDLILSNDYVNNNKINTYYIRRYLDYLYSYENKNEKFLEFYKNINKDFYDLIENKDKIIEILKESLIYKNIIDNKIKNDNLELEELKKDKYIENYIFVKNLKEKVNHNQLVKAGTNSYNFIIKNLNNLSNFNNNLNKFKNNLIIYEIENYFSNKELIKINNFKEKINIIFNELYKNELIIDVNKIKKIDKEWIKNNITFENIIDSTEKTFSVSFNTYDFKKTSKTNIYALTPFKIISDYQLKNIVKIVIDNKDNKKIKLLNNLLKEILQRYMTEFKEYSIKFMEENKEDINIKIAKNYFNELYSNNVKFIKDKIKELDKIKIINNDISK